MNQAFNPYTAQLEQIEQQLLDNQALMADPEMSELAQEEIKQLEAAKASLESAAAAYLSSQQADGDSNADIAGTANAIIEIRGGAGGDEAKIWASDLMRMYTRYAATKNLKVELIDDLVFKVRGQVQLPVWNVDATGEMQDSGTTETVAAYKLFRYDSGVHRVQRVPSTEAAGRIHTSTASVAVLPEVTAAAVEIREEDLEWSFMRAGGAGGQSVNKTNSAVRLVHRPSGLVVNARQERKQAQNRQIALELLRGQLWQIEEDKKQAALGEARSNIGRNMRAEKIKTYNFPQSRVTDHRIHHSWHHLFAVLEGDLDEVLAITRAKIENNETVTTEENSATDLD